MLRLSRSASLAAVVAFLPARTGEKIERGRVYVAVPGVHFLLHVLHDGHILLGRGPRENLTRPAVDPLFRSAACTFGSRVIGVVLSGSLSDGTAGLRAIKRCGWIAIVQEPSDAAVREMPLSALHHTEVDHMAPAAGLGDLLTRLTQERVSGTPPVPPEIRLEAAIAAQELSGMETENELGKPSRFTCPECNGALWEIDDASLLRYRCHIGHAYTAEAMLEAQTTNAEQML
jgi:two-component system chemotaxis response regulator CheB